MSTLFFFSTLLGKEHSARAVDCCNMNALDWIKIAFVCSLLLSSVARNAIATTLAFGDDFPAHHSLGDLLGDLLLVQQDWLHPGILIVFGITFVLAVGVSMLRPARRMVVNAHARRIAIVASTASWTIFFVPTMADAHTTVLGRMMSADLALMIAFQTYLLAAGELPLESVLTGPLGACALAPCRFVLSPGSVTRCAIFVLLLLPAIYRENGRAQSVRETFVALNPVELYAWFQVVFTATYLIVVNVPYLGTAYGVPRSWRYVISKWGTMLLFVACANHNVAAAWALAM